MSKSFLLAPVLLALALPVHAADEAAAPAKPAKAAPKAAAKAGAKAPGKGAAPAAAASGKELPEDVRNEMSYFVKQAVQLAAPALEKGEVFLPYAVFTGEKDRELKSMAWGKDTAPPSNALLAELLRRLRVMAKQNPDIVMAATVVSASVPAVGEDKRVNGIRVEVDHRRGEPRIVFIPYEFKDGKLVLGTLVYMGGTNPIFNWKEPPAPAGAAPAAAAPAAAGKDAPAKDAPAKDAPAKDAPAAAVAPAPAPAAAPAAAPANP